MKRSNRMNDVEEMESKTLEISKTYNASLERVWNAWTNPDEISKWWIPDGFTQPSIPEIDLRLGGELKYHLQPAEGDAFYAHGVFKEIIPNELIRSTWQWSHADQETLLTVKFTKVDDGTQLTIIHELFQDEDQKNSHSDGWNKCMSKIEDLF